MDDRDSVDDVTDRTISDNVEGDSSNDSCSSNAGAEMTILNDDPTKYSAMLKLNQETMIALQSAITDDPVINLTETLSNLYSSKHWQILYPRKPMKPLRSASHNFFTGSSPDHIRIQMERNNDPIEVLHPLSTTVSSLIEQYKQSGSSDDDLSHSTFDEGVRTSDIAALFKASRRVHVQNVVGVVYQISRDIAAKVRSSEALLNEYAALQYLQSEGCDFPVPQPLGLLRADYHYVMFMTYMPGTALSELWSQLSGVQKRAAQLELEQIIQKMRRLPPRTKLLGSVAGTGVQDDRRFSEATDEPMTTAQEFEEWQFSQAQDCVSPFYLSFLRSLLPKNDNPIVFTHGDLCPVNILARIVPSAESSAAPAEDTIEITGIVDWETAGFYPASHEGIKAMSTMTLGAKKNDWWFYLPPSIAPDTMPVRFLVDVLLERALYKLH